MAVAPLTLYPGQTLAGDPGYPHGKARNITVTADGTGTPWEEQIANDIFGFQQALLDRVGFLPSGTPDKVGASQYLTALELLAKAASHRVAIASHIAAPSIGSFSFMNAIAAGPIAGGPALLGVGGNGTTHRVQFTLDGGDTWSGPTLATSTFGFRDVVHSGTRFVAVSESECAHSTDGTTWTFAVSGDFSFEAKAICRHGASRLVTVGELSTIRTSDNHGSSWTLRSSPVVGCYLQDVASSGTRLVAVGANASLTAPVIWTSDDGGVNWTVRSPVASAATILNTVGHNGTLWVAAGNAGVIMISRDGTTWTAVANGGSFGGAFKNVGYTGALWILVGESGEIETSEPSAKVWKKSFDRGGTFEYRAIGVSSDGGFAAIGGNAAAFRRSLAW